MLTLAWQNKLHDAMDDRFGEAARQQQAMPWVVAIGRQLTVNWPIMPESSCSRIWQ